MRLTLALALGALSACTAQPDASVPASGTQIAAGAATDTIGVSLPVPPLPDSAFPRTPFGREALRGRAILIATRDSLPAYVGNGLRCTSCHLDEGRRPYAMTWVGVHARYPQYRSRSASVQTLDDRINDCFERSLGGKALPAGDARLRAIGAYLAFISRGTEIGATTVGQGIDSVHATTPDTVRGARVFAESCARCHGANGAGTPLATPVWGEHSYSIGAGMGRYRTAAGFVQRNMPFDKPGGLTDQDALDVATFIDSRPRRDFAGKERDWPQGGAPPDVPYKTLGVKKP